MLEIQCNQAKTDGGGSQAPIGPSWLRAMLTGGSTSNTTRRVNR